MYMPRVSPSFEVKVRGPVRASAVDVLQINLGYRCNLECRHCHARGGPDRTEIMSREVMEGCLTALRGYAIPVIDITGGSPELHPGFAWFLGECASLRRRLLVRSNGVLLLEKEHAYLLDQYTEQRIEVILSLPHVDARLTDRQRGEGVFARLIEVMRRLNRRGYGRAGSGLVLDLVHNPAGAYLPASQEALESHYRRVLNDRYGVAFNHLFCITNMPIGRYLEYLVSTENFEEYMARLIAAFNPGALDRVMCRSTVSVGWDGTLYDCDFNQVLHLTINHGSPSHISRFDIASLTGRRIKVGDHCYGCTAGAGSSCQGQMS